jgi:transposase
VPPTLVRTSRTQRSADVIALLAEIDRRWEPTPRGVARPVVLALAHGPLHTGKATRAAPAERAHRLAVEGLPKDAPELNDIEVHWRDLKRHHLAHRTFTGPDDLDRTIHGAVATLNAERRRHPLASQPLAA